MYEVPLDFCLPTVPTLPTFSQLAIPKTSQHDRTIAEVPKFMTTSYPGGCYYLSPDVAHPQLSTANA